MGINRDVVFIHGLHENAHSWNLWKVYFEQKGYTCHTPDYPYHSGNPSCLRQNPNPNLASLRFRDIVAHCSNFIDTLSNKQPILIGHSMGGLVVQKLIAEKKGTMGICITTASPKGILSLKWSFVKSNLGTVNPLMGNSIFLGSKAWFHYAICNTLTREQSDKIYENAVIPEGRNIPRSSRLQDGKIDFNKPHRPILFISAEKDHIIPMRLNIKNFNAYKDTNSIKEFKCFEGKSHCLCVADGWEEIADFVSEWIIKIGK